jgi:hypothetical protein
MGTETNRNRYMNNIDSSSHYKKPSDFRGGILADMMGLGKTLSMISLVAHDKVLGKESRLLDANGTVLGKGTLIVVPPSCEYSGGYYLNLTIDPLQCYRTGRMNSRGRSPTAWQR